jgi:hypothetical protein
MSITTNSISKAQYTWILIGQALGYIPYTFQTSSSSTRKSISNVSFNIARLSIHFICILLICSWDAVGYGYNVCRVLYDVFIRKNDKTVVQDYFLHIVGWSFSFVIVDYQNLLSGFLLAIIPSMCHCLNVVYFIRNGSKDLALVNSTNGKIFLRVIVLYVVSVIVSTIAYSCGLHASALYRTQVIEKHPLWFIILDIITSTIIHIIQFMVVMFSIFHILVIIEIHLNELKLFMNSLTGDTTQQPLYTAKELIQKHEKLETSMINNGKAISFTWLPLLAVSFGAMGLNVFIYIQGKSNTTKQSQRDVWTFFLIGCIYFIPSSVCFYRAAQLNDLFFGKLVSTIDSYFLRLQQVSELRSFYSYLLLCAYKPEKGFPILTVTISYGLLSQLLAPILTGAFFILQSYLSRLSSENQ